MFIVPMTLFSCAFADVVVRRVDHQPRVDDGVDLGRLDHPAQQRVLGADLHVLGALELDLRLLVVDADDRLDLGERPPAPGPAARPSRSTGR